MRKQFKSIAATFMMAIMLVTISVPAMAAEQVSATDDTLVESFAAENTAMPLSTYQLVSQFHKTDYITGNTNWGYFYISNAWNQIRFTVGDGSGDGLVRITLKNRSTGEEKGFTAAGNGHEGTINFAQTAPAGQWQISAQLVSGSNIRGITLNFYKV